jgi:NUMOD4 motif/HNH endonuclease
VTENWLPVPDYEGLYAVSDRGRIRSLHGKTRVAGYVLKPTVSRAGYLVVSLVKDTKQVQRKVHRLVLLAFKGPCLPGLESRHLDGNPANNALTNLAWGTVGENAKDRVRHGTHGNSSKTHCPQGHEYTEKNTAYDGLGRRRCRACNRARVRQWQEAHPERVREMAREWARTSRAAKRAPGDTCPQGHVFDAVASNGKRYCMQCRKANGVLAMASRWGTRT